MKQQGEELEAIALYQDHTYGPTIASFMGKLKDNVAEFALSDFQGVAPAIPLTVDLSLKFDKDFRIAEGSWKTDIGTHGSCKIQAISMSVVRWWLYIVRANVGFFFRRHTPTVYGVLLLLVVLLDLLKIFQISYPALILLLVPSLYIYRNFLAELVRLFRIRKIGPVEFEQAPLTEQTRLVISQQVQETVAFSILDLFFVPRTKIILLWLSQQGAIRRAQFNAYATAIGVLADNLDVTWNALIASGCAKVTATGLITGEETLTIADLGRRYVQHLSGGTRV
jgi:hypothetical protein